MLGLLELYGVSLEGVLSLRHIEISPPQHYTYKRARKEFTERIVPMLTADGGGAVVLFHSMRVDQEAKDEVEALREAGEYRGGDWDYLRERGELYSRTHYGPHFHLMASCFLPQADLFHARTGWTYKHIRYVDGPKQRRDLLRYQLSHAHYFGRRNVYWTIGQFASKKMRKEIEKNGEDRVCECCGGTCHDLEGFSCEVSQDTLGHPKAAISLRSGTWGKADQVFQWRYIYRLRKPPAGVRLRRAPFFILEEDKERPKVPDDVGYLDDFASMAFPTVKGAIPPPAAAYPHDLKQRAGVRSL